MTYSKVLNMNCDQFCVEKGRDFCTDYYTYTRLRNKNDVLVTPLAMSAHHGQTRNQIIYFNIL